MCSYTFEVYYVLGGELLVWLCKGVFRGCWFTLCLLGLMPNVGGYRVILLGVCYTLSFLGVWSIVIVL